MESLSGSGAEAAAAAVHFQFRPECLIKSLAIPFPLSSANFIIISQESYYYSEFMATIPSKVYWGCDGQKGEGLDIPKNQNAPFAS